MSKFRNWRLTSYLNLSQLRSVLDEHSTQIKAFAYILHDKDLTEEGTPKTPHFHLLLGLHNATSLNGLLSWFDGFVDDTGNDINTLAKVMNNRKGAFAYLTHNTCASKDKFQYSPDDIVYFNSEFFENDDDDKDDKINLAFNDLIDGISLDDVRRKYGRDFIIHYNHIKALYNDIQKQIGGKPLGI